MHSHLEAENPLVRREMPFAAFQRVMTSILNAVIIDHVQTVNAEDRHSNEAIPLNLIPDTTYTPAPIMEYFQSISNTTTPQDDLVKINIPEIAVPNGRTSAVGDISKYPAGGFGPCTTASHNIYECYVSPLVTSQLVMETLDQNEMNDFGAWDPLPDGMYPVNAVVNSNLLRYRQNVERLNAEGQQSLHDIVFPNGDNMHSRIRWSDKLAARVSNTLQSMQNKYKMVVGKPVHAMNTSILGWTKVDVVDGYGNAVNTSRLAMTMGTVHSSVAMGNAQCNIAGTFALRRERTPQARGLCYTTETGVANFSMQLPFTATIGRDFPTLRDSRHT